jgi:hypothetical protein
LSRFTVETDRKHRSKRCRKLNLFNCDGLQTKVETNHARHSTLSNRHFRTGQATGILLFNRSRNRRSKVKPKWLWINKKLSNKDSSNSIPTSQLSYLNDVISENSQLQDPIQLQRQTQILKSAVDTPNKSDFQIFQNQMEIESNKSFIQVMLGWTNNF